MSNKTLKELKGVKYLGVILDSNLNWKQHIHELTKINSRSIGFLCKLRHFVPSKIILQIYYSIIFPFLTCVQRYGEIHIQLIYVLQYQSKREQLESIRILTFSHFQAHTSHLIKKFNLFKVHTYIHTLYFHSNYQSSSIELISSRKKNT